MDQTIVEPGTAAAWRQLFESWPSNRPRRGLVFADWQETISFDSYLISDEILFLNRPQPDGLGARKVMIPFSRIAAVKFIDVFELDEFASLGFH